MAYTKLPGGEAHGMEKRDFSKKEQQAIDKGSKMEIKEHGPMAPKEIAADHVVEHGAVYYNDKKGLPAMEKKLEKAGAKPASFNEFHSEAPAYGTIHNLDSAGHLHFAREHQKKATQHAIAGNKESAVYHHKQAKLYWDAHRGNVAPVEVREIKQASEPNPKEVLQKPPVSQAQRGAMHAAAAGKSTLGIPKKVGKEFAATDKPGKLPETVKKADITNIKTGKKVNPTEKRVEKQPMGTNSGYPTPGVVSPNSHAIEVSNKIRAKFAANRENKGFADKLKQKASEPYSGPGPDHAERTKRIQQSLIAVNKKLGEEPGNTEQKPKPDLHIVKSSSCIADTLKKAKGYIEKSQGLQKAGFGAMLNDFVNGSEHVPSNTLSAGTAGGTTGGIEAARESTNKRMGETAAPVSKSSKWSALLVKCQKYKANKLQKADTTPPPPPPPPKVPDNFNADPAATNFNKKGVSTMKGAFGG